MEPQAWPHLSCLKCEVRGQIVCLPHPTRGHHNKDARLLPLTLRWALSSELMEETLRGATTLCPALDRHTHNLGAGSGPTFSRAVSKCLKVVAEELLLLRGLG